MRLKLILNYLESVRFNSINKDFHFFRLLFLPTFNISTEQIFALSKTVFKKRRSLDKDRFIDFLQKEQIASMQNLFGECAVDEVIINAYDRIAQLTNAFLNKNVALIVEQIKQLGIPLETLDEIQLQSILAEKDGAAFKLSMNDFLAIEIEKFDESPVLKWTLDAATKIQISQFVWSVSALQQYLDCPLQFAIGNIWQGPRECTASALRGTAIHKLMESFFKTMRDNEDQFPTLDWFITEFERYYNFNSEEEEAQTIDMLVAYYQQNIDYWPKMVVLEMLINAQLNGVAAKGIIDKLEFNGRKVNIVDYKSGNVARGLRNLQSPDNLQPYGGHYWLQAVFYKLLVASTPKNWEVDQVKFDFLQKDENGHAPTIALTITQEDEQFVLDLLKSVAQKVLQYDFNTGCGKIDCPYCQLAFAKENDG